MDKFEKLQDVTSGKNSEENVNYFVKFLHILNVEKIYFEQLLQTCVQLVSFRDHRTLHMCK